MSTKVPGMGQLEVGVLIEARLGWILELLRAFNKLVSSLRYRGTPRVKVGCEEIAFEQGFIDSNQLKQIAQPLVRGYGKYLLKLLK